MAEERFVARSRLHHGGVKDGVNQEVWYEAGDEIDTAIFTETDVAAALGVGTIVPKAVWDALQRAEEARLEAEQAQLQAEATLNRLQHVSRSAGTELDSMQSGELSDEERVQAVTDKLTDEADRVASEPPVETNDNLNAKSSTAKPATVRSKAGQNPEDTTDKSK